MTALHYTIPESNDGLGQGALWLWEDLIQEAILRSYHPLSYYWIAAGFVSGDRARGFLVVK